MATKKWVGGAPAVAQVYTWVFTNAGTAGDIVTITIGSKSYAYTTTSGTLATFLPLLATALNALSSSVYPEFAEITWGSSSTTLTGTSDTPGKPFTASVSTNSGTTTINTAAISDATNATPIVITSNSHGLTTGTRVTIASVGGNTAANGTWIITRVNANTFSLNTSVGNGAYTSGGTWSAPTGVATTLSSGPYDVSTGANYSDGSIPANGDTLYIDQEGARLYYGLDQSAIGVVLAARRITAKDVVIGLPVTNRDGTAYPEYRSTYWCITATADFVSTQSGRIKLNHGTGQTTFEIEESGNGTERNIPAVLCAGNHASNVWNIYGGNFGLAFFSTDVGRIATMRIDKGATVTLGIGVTIATINNYGGTLEVNSAIATALNHPSANGGTTRINGSGAVAQITMQSGTCYYNTTGALGGDTVLSGNAVLSVDEEAATKTITNAINIYSPTARFSDINGVVSGGYTVKFHNCAPTSLQVKPNSQLVVSAL